jgi:hypothetical protein
MPTLLQNMSSSNSNIGLLAEPAYLPDGFLMPPVWEMVAGITDTAEEIVDRAVLVSEAYLYHCIFTAHPSPKCPLPQMYADLLIGLPPATPEHAKRIMKSLHYIVTSENFFYTASMTLFIQFEDILEKNTMRALCAMCSHWDVQTAHARLFLETHNYILSKDIDVDPNPPQEHIPNALQRSSSIGPPGTDLYLYQGSYIMAIEKMLGYVPGRYDFDSDEEKGGDLGFLRSVGKQLLLPSLHSRLTTLIAGYQAHPVVCIANPLHMLGIPRFGYVLNPLCLSEQPTADDLMIADEWNKIVQMQYKSIREEDLEKKTLNMLQRVKDSLITLKSDAEATLLMLKASAIASATGIQISPDMITYMGSFVGTRLPDSAPEFQIRRRPACVSDEAMGARGAL